MQAPTDPATSESKPPVAREETFPAHGLPLPAGSPARLSPGTPSALLHATAPTCHPAATSLATSPLPASFLASPGHVLKPAQGMRAGAATLPQKAAGFPAAGGNLLGRFLSPGGAGLSPNQREGLGAVTERLAALSGPALQVISHILATTPTRKHATPLIATRGNGLSCDPTLPHQCHCPNHRYHFHHSVETSYHQA